MLKFGSGNNDRMHSGDITTTDPVVGDISSLVDTNCLSYQLITTDGDGVQGGGAAGGIQGTWKVEASNSTSTAGDQAEGALWDEGVWRDITGEFSPAIGAADGTGQEWMLVIQGCPWRLIRLTFTPTSGTGAGQRVYAYAVAKTYGGN